MEERIIDDPRKIRIEKTAAGGVKDATDELAPETAAEEEDVLLDLPEELDENLDEDLIGLSPSQLKAELERRERAAEEAVRERDKLLAEGERALQAKNYAAAEPYFVQAAVYDPACARAGEGIWISRTQNFTDLEALLEPQNAAELSEADEGTRAFVKGHAGERLEAERVACLAEAGPLEASFTAKQTARRGKLNDNRSYYLIRFLIVFGVTVLLLAAAAVSAAFIVRSRGLLPVILTAAFGGAALLVAIVLAVYARKLVVASRYCRENERLSSTEEGMRLEELRQRLDSLALVLDGKQDEEIEEEK